MYTPEICIRNFCICKFIIRGYRSDLETARNTGVIREEDLPELCSTSVETAFAATVTIITTCDHERHRGTTATAMTFVSMDPPSLVVCVNQKTLSHDVMVRARQFCVNVLRRDHPSLSAAFGADLPSEKRFEAERWLRCEDGLPFVADAQANLFRCKAAAVAYGTHTMFVGQVEKVGLGGMVAPLVYQDGSYRVTASAYEETPRKWA